MSSFPYYGDDPLAAKGAMNAFRAGVAWNTSSAGIAAAAPVTAKGLSKKKPAPPPKTGLEKWKDMVRKAATDARWNGHDQKIKDAIASFDAHLAATPGYKSPPFNLIKAMVWTESGGPDGSVWDAKTIQIGVPGDPGLKTLVDGAEGSNLIVPATLKSKLSTKDIATPAVNIAAGIAYLLTRLSEKSWRDVPDPVDTASHDVEVKAGDSLDKIAHRVGTTTATLKAANPGADRMIKPGQVLHYTKAKSTYLIDGFKAIDAANISKFYNGGGDKNYEEKLKFCVAVMTGTNP